MDQQPGKTYPTVAYVTNNSGLGGGETSLLNLLQVLLENGRQPVLVCPAGQLALQARQSGLAVHPMRFPDVHLRAGLFPTFSLSTVYAMYHILKQQGVQIVHAESLLGLYYGGLAACLAKVPCVATCHGYWPFSATVARFFFRYFCQRIYPVSNTVAGELKKALPSASGKVQTIPLGFNKKFLAPLPSQRDARRIVKLPVDRPIIMQIARFQAIKGQMHVLDALAELIRRQNVMVPFVVFIGGIFEGGAPDADAYKTLVERRAQTPELRNYVQFLDHRNDVPTFMRAADVVVSPSDFETFGMTMIEAMVVGTPVVATAVGGQQEILEDQVTGILVPPNNPIALAEGIARVLSNPELAIRLAKKAKETALALYHPQIRYARLQAEYSQLTR